MIISTSEENYIKCIYHLQKHDELVTTTDLSGMLQTKPASVTDMLKKLKIKKLIFYERYQGFKLTGLGEKLALSIVRKHRLWEYFLVHKLGFEWDKVHAIAEELEHIRSLVLIEKLNTFLGSPKFDPHGDPIPDMNGKMQAVKQIKLTDLTIDHQAEVSAVGDQSTELLELLRHKNISIGTVVKALRKFTFDNSIEIKVKDFPPFSISHQLASTLFVKPIYGSTTV